MPDAMVKYDEVAGEPVRNKQGHMIRVKHNEGILFVGIVKMFQPQNLRILLAAYHLYRLQLYMTSISLVRMEELG